MAIPIDILKEDKSNQDEIYQKIIYCCNKMQSHLIDPAYKGLAFHPRTELDPNVQPMIVLAPEINDDPEPIDYCPFCGIHIEIRPS